MKQVIGVIMLAVMPILAQLKPDASLTKIEKVLVYDKVGGWVHQDGIPAVNEAVQQLGTQYGFDVTVTDDESSIELNFLSTFQVVIWNNNVNGGASLQSTSARNALMQYINNGGGYLAIHGAGDHGDTWVQLRDVIGTTFSRHGDQGNGTLAWDDEALNHNELSVMLEGHDPSTLFEEWYSFQNSPRGLDGFTIVASVSGAGNIVVSLDQPDPLGIIPAVWVKDQGNNNGKVLYTSIGHVRDIYQQQNNWGRAFLWDNMRYVANDFNYGCTDESASNFDSEARIDDDSCEGIEVSGCTDPEAPNYNPNATIDDGSCQPVGIHVNGKSVDKRQIEIQPGTLNFKVFSESDYKVKIMDIIGGQIFSKNGRGNNEFEQKLRPGIYVLMIDYNGHKTDMIRVLAL